LQACKVYKRGKPGNARLDVKSILRLIFLTRVVCDPLEGIGAEPACVACVQVHEEFDNGIG